MPLKRRMPMRRMRRIRRRTFRTKIKPGTLVTTKKLARAIKSKLSAARVQRKKLESISTNVFDVFTENALFDSIEFNVVSGNPLNLQRTGRIVYINYIDLTINAENTSVTPSLPNSAPLFFHVSITKNKKSASVVPYWFRDQATDDVITYNSGGTQANKIIIAKNNGAKGAYSFIFKKEFYLAPNILGNGPNKQHMLRRFRIPMRDQKITYDDLAGVPITSSSTQPYFSLQGYMLAPSFFGAGAGVTGTLNVSAEVMYSY